MNILNTKKIIISVLCVMILLMSFLIIYKLIINNKNDSKKGDIKNSIVPEEVDKKMKFLKYDGRTVKDDDYTITLEKYYYEADINTGHCLISVMQEGKNGEDIYCALENEQITGGQLGFGGTNINNQIYYIDYLFELHPGKGGLCGEIYRKSYSDKNKKYIYFDFENLMIGFKDAIVVKNKYKEELEVSFTSEGIGVFKLEDNTDWRIFTSGNNKIAICHYGVEINDGQVSNIANFEIYMKNGSKHTIKKGDMKEVQYEYKSKITQLRFEDSIDINDIDYIEWNGNRIY